VAASAGHHCSAPQRFPAARGTTGRMLRQPLQADEILPATRIGGETIRPACRFGHNRLHTADRTRTAERAFFSALLAGVLAGHRPQRDQVVIEDDSSRVEQRKDVRVAH